MKFAFVLCIILICVPGHGFANDNRVTGYYVRNHKNETPPKPSDMIGTPSQGNKRIHPPDDPVEAIWSHYQSLQGDKGSPGMQSSSRSAKHTPQNDAFGLTAILRKRQAKKSNARPMQTLNLQKKASNSETVQDN